MSSNTASKPGASTVVPDKQPAIEAANALATAGFTTGAVYTGTIESRSEQGTYTVKCDQPNKSVTGVILAFPALGGLFGFNIRAKLTESTKVLMTYGNPCFIVATLPNTAPGPKEAGNRTIVGGRENDERTTMDWMADLPEDLMEGEIDISNNTGVALQLLSTLARLGAGDRAKIECFFIHDLVRIIAKNYQHITGIGDDHIFDVGRNTLERGWSSYRHELEGLLKDNDPLFEKSGDLAEMGKMDDERINVLGRYRLLEFMGFAGDFIHSFVTDPASVLQSYASEALENRSGGAGKSWFHRNSDGTCILQSVADIRMELVPRIPVPFRKRSVFDPSVATDYEALTKSFITLPPAGSGPSALAYHIRTYARWLSRYHAFARMLQMPDDYGIPTENDSQEPSYGCGEKDKEQCNPGSAYTNSYACIAILRNGAIVVHDTWGSTVMLSGGNVQLSAARHLYLEAAGSVHIMAGESFIVKARKHIDLIAATGSILIQSYAGLCAFCERGGIWLRSAARFVAGTAFGDTPVLDTTPKDANDVDAPIPEVYDGHAILVEATNMGMGVRLARTLHAHIDGTYNTNPANGDVELDENGKLKDPTNTRLDFIATTSGNLRVAAKRGLTTHTDFMTSISSTKAVAISTKALRIPVSEATIGGLIVQQNAVFAPNLSCGTFESDGITGPAYGNLFSTQYAPNHIRAFKDGEKARRLIARDEDAGEAINIANGIAVSPSAEWPSVSVGAQFGAPPPDRYNWDSRDTPIGAVPETLTQQYIRQDVGAADTIAPGFPLDAWNGNGYSTWNIAMSLSEAPRTITTGTAGHGGIVYVADDADGSDLRTPSTTPAADLPKPNIAWKAGDTNFFYLRKSPTP